MVVSATEKVSITQTNFSDCSCLVGGGGLCLESDSPVTLSLCRCVGCHVAGSSYSPNGGGMFVYSEQHVVASTISDLFFDDCHSDHSGGGLFLSVSFADSIIAFIYIQQCSSAIGVNSMGNGGGMVLTISRDISITIRNLRIEDCCSEGLGGGLNVQCPTGSASLSDCQFIRCRLNGTTGTTGTGGAIMATAYSKKCSITNCEFDDCSSNTLGGAVLFSASSLLLSNILFVGNTVGATPVYPPADPSSERTQFVDIAVYDAREKTTQRIQFTDGNYVLTSLSTTKSLKFDTEYTITSIVGVVPASSSSLSNVIEIPVAAWAFNLAATPSFATFTTPPQPPTLIGATAHLVSDESNSTHVIIVFNEKVKGSFVFVVEEGGKDVEISVHIPDPSIVGESENFVVAGTNKVLSNDANYTIKSISPETEPEADSTAIVWMNDTIKFHVPKLPDIPPSTQGIVVVARDGSDSMDECGREDLPCRTVWKGQMVEKGKGGEWMSVLVRGSAEMGEGFWIEGNMRMTLSSESSTQRSRVVIGGSSLSSLDGIVTICSATVQVRDLNVILPPSEERSSSRWAFVVDSDGTLEADSLGLSGEGEIGVGLAKVKSGTGRFNSILIWSGSSFGSGVGVIVGEGNGESISVLISEMVIRDTTTSNTPLIAFSSLSPLSTFKMEGSRFQKTRLVIQSSLSSDGAGVIEVSTAQSRTEISDCVFESSGVIVGTRTITRSALHVTLDSSSTSWCSLVISSCLFLDSHPSSSLSASLHIQVLSGLTTIVFEDSWFEETTPTRMWTRFDSGIACLDWTRGRVASSSSTLNGALIENWKELPIFVRRHGVFSNCKLVMSKKS
ncbi:hypothetical protein BLNAU_5530 [Blattamonas nauphoetae]|uniref:Right handed beta helix domain-containing protein n=1 Tax=Blattamonas nauphoetae TaxID=2049346 RepID=A0ABQ9Y6X0_9EUKA|nr:hypothetical protein BLNAU_5530 [Blattamonas nauphoetae]